MKERQQQTKGVSEIESLDMRECVVCGNFTERCPSCQVCRECIDCACTPEEIFKTVPLEGNLVCISCRTVEKHRLRDTAAHCQVCDQMFNEDVLTSEELVAEGVDREFLLGLREIEMAVRLADADTAPAQSGLLLPLFCRNCRKNTPHRTWERDPDVPNDRLDRYKCDLCATIRMGAYQMNAQGAVVELDEYGSAKTTTSYGGGRYGSYGLHGGWESLCSHWRQPIQIGQLTIHCSAASDRPTGGESALTPDFGLYFDMQWAGSVLCSPDFPVDELRLVLPYPKVVYTWRDMGAPRSVPVQHLVDWVIDKMKAGKSVDIGCWGGHGRTGTFLALLIVKLEECRAEEAIKRVRARLCAQAIESYAQCKFIYEYAGERPPDPPSSIPTKSLPAPVMRYQGREERRQAKRERRRRRRQFNDMVKSAAATGVKSRNYFEKDGRYWWCLTCYTWKQGTGGINFGVAQTARWFVSCIGCGRATQHGRPPILYQTMGD